MGGRKLAGRCYHCRPWPSAPLTHFSAPVPPSGPAPQSCLLFLASLCQTAPGSLSSTSVIPSPPRCSPSPIALQGLVTTARLLGPFRVSEQALLALGG